MTCMQVIYINEKKKKSPVEPRKEVGGQRRYLVAVEIQDLQGATLGLLEQTRGDVTVVPSAGVVDAVVRPV